MAQTDPRAFKTAKNGNQLNIVGPKPTLKTVATKPPNVAKTLTATKVNKGWNNVNSTEAKNLKNKFAQQNPVPGNLPKTTNALVKPTIIGNKAAGNNANNPPGTSKGGNSTIAGNKGARAFYEGLGGELIVAQPFQWDGMDLTEAGYGWRDLDALAAACRIDALAAKP